MLSQYSKFLKWVLISAVIFSIFLIMGCSGSNKSGNNPTSPHQPGTNSISGMVGGAISNGVSISLSGSASQNTITASDGRYNFSGLASGSYIIIPYLTGYIFNPVSVSITISNKNVTQNFVATAMPASTYSISGKVILSGSGLTNVALTLSGTSSGSTTTASDGSYSFSNLINGSYTITPSLWDYTFSPACSMQTVHGGNVININFTATTLGPNPWPKFHQNNLNTGLSPYDTSSDTGTLKWSYPMGHIWSSPAIGADGTIYVGSDNYNLYAINPNGGLKWSYTTGWNVESSPAIGPDGTIYVGSFDNKLYAINPNGTLKWSYTTGSVIYFSSPAIGSDGTIYVGSFDNKLYAINPNGTLKWSYTTGNIINSSPAIGSDGTVYVGSEDGCLYAINPNGGLKWSYTTGNIIDASPAIGADGTVYVGSEDGCLYAINPNGGLKWTYSTGSSIQNSTPAIGADGTVYVGSINDNLYAINPNGGLKWTYSTGGSITSSPAIGSDGTIYVESGDVVYAINPSGTLKWSYTTGLIIGYSSIAIGSDGTIYFGTNINNKLYAIH